MSVHHDRNCMLRSMLICSEAMSVTLIVPLAEQCVTKGLVQQHVYDVVYIHVQDILMSD